MGFAQAARMDWLLSDWIRVRNLPVKADVD